MTKMKKNYVNLSPAELAAEVTKLRQQIAKAKLDLTVGKLKNVRQIFNLRKQLAVVYSYAKRSR
mgnify:FL=1